MDMKFPKVSDNGPHVVDLKRKRPARFEAYVNGGTSVMLPMQSTSALKLGKSRKLDGTKRKYDCSVSPCGKCSLKYYSNFKKSEIPDRLMHYQNGKWNNFPQDIVSIVKRDFVKKSALEVEFDGSMILLDFLHMMMLDMNSGLRRPIAWIDVSGKSYFPEIFGEYAKDHGCGVDYNEAEDDTTSESLGSNDINFHVEVEINGIEAYKLKESSGELNATSREKSAEKAIDYEGTDSCVKAPDTEVIKKFGENKLMAREMASAANPIKGHLDFEAVKALLLQAVGQSYKTEILELHHCSSIALDARFEIFQKQVEITKRYRGDPNVLYAWLPCSKGMVYSILNYGVGTLNLRNFHSCMVLGLILSLLTAGRSENFFLMLTKMMHDIWYSVG